MKAPYTVGDKATGMCQIDSGATVLATMPVTRVTSLSTHGQWRIECARPESPKFPTVAYTVGVDGKDTHGYVEPAKVTS